MKTGLQDVENVTQDCIHVFRSSLVDETNLDLVLKAPFGMPSASALESCQL